MADILTQDEIDALLDIVEDSDIGYENKIKNLIDNLKELSPSGNINDIYFKIPQDILLEVITILESITELDPTTSEFDIFEGVDLDRFLIEIFESLTGNKIIVEKNTSIINEDEKDKYLFFKIQLKNNVYFVCVSEEFGKLIHNQMIAEEDEYNAPFNDIIDATSEYLKCLIKSILFFPRKNVRIIWKIRFK